jgi:hypothetical protein
MSISRNPTTNLHFDDQKYPLDVSQSTPLTVLRVDELLAAGFYHKPSAAFDSSAYAHVIRQVSLEAIGTVSILAVKRLMEWFALLQGKLVYRIV